MQGKTFGGVVLKLSNVVNLVWYAGGEYLRRVTPRPTSPRLMLLEEKKNANIYDNYSR